MSKDYRESRSLIWVYRSAENPKGTASTAGGVAVPLDSGSFIKLKRGNEDDGDEVAGREGPSRLFQTALDADGTLKQTRARPDFILWALSFFFGSASSQVAGTGAYKHTLSPLADPDHPAFTAGQRLGDSVMKERYVHNLVKGFKLSLGDGWVGMEASVSGSGKRDVNYTKEIVAAPENSTTIALAANAVEGATSADRVENVRLVRVKKVGENQWTTVAVTDVSSATPAVLTITAPGTNSGSVNYEVYYHPLEASYFSPPASLDESPLRVVDSKVVLDGYFDGTDVLGGIALTDDLMECEIIGENDLSVQHAPDGSGDIFANQSYRVGRSITIKTSRRFRDIVRQSHADLNENISVLFRARGASIPGSGGVDFGLDLIFPSVGIVDAPIAVKDKILAEEGDLRVLVDPAWDMGRVFGWNTVSQYL